MARILIAWEFSANLGHLAQLLPIAARLRAKGHQVVFAVRDVTRAEEVLGRHEFEYLQAPVWHERRARASAIPCSYSEILQQNGYADREGLVGMLKAWREIYRLVEPRAVLFDHAPTALLASRGFEWARVLCGVGFCSPPRVSPFPNFRTWEEVSAGAAGAQRRASPRDHQLGAREAAAPSLGAAHELFNVDDEFLCTFPELDHYGSPPGRFVLRLGIHPRRRRRAAVWPEHGRKRVYVYLPPEVRAFAAVGEMLSDSGAQRALGRPRNHGQDRSPLSEPHAQVSARTGPPLRRRDRARMRRCSAEVTARSRRSCSRACRWRYSRSTSSRRS